MMRYLGPRNRRALTLLELVISMGLATLALGLGLQLYVKTQEAIDRQQLRAGRLGAETDLLALLRRDLRGAAAVAAGSTAERLVLVAGDGSRIAYEVTPAGVQRTGPEGEAATPPVIEGLRPRFAYPAAGGRRGRVVEVSWSEGRAPRSVTLHLRNGGRL